MNKLDKTIDRLEYLEVPTIADKIFENLKDKILSGFHRPGQKLSEVEIGKLLGTSRSPVREALQRLDKEGLVNLVPRKGAVICVMESEEIKDYFELREALEVLAARLSAERAEPCYLKEMQGILEKAKDALQCNQYSTYPWDSDFHKQLFRMAKNPKLEEVGVNLCLKLQLIRYHLGSQRGRARIAMKEHEEILNAIMKKDPSGAEKAIKHHLRNSKKNLILVMKNSEGIKLKN